MNILIVNTFYYPKFTGGAEISVQLLAEGLVRSGHRVAVITSGEKKAVTRVNGVIVIRIRQRNVYSTCKVSRQPALLKIIWHLVDSCNPFNYFLISRLIKRIRPAVVHTNNIQGFSPFIWAIVKKSQLPLLHTFRDYYMICHKANYFNHNRKCEGLCTACRMTYAIKKHFVRYPDAYVGISSFILEKHQEFFSMKEQLREVIYNSVNQAVTSQLPQKKEKVVFGFMGRISEEKGAAYMVEELAGMQEHLKPQFKILFAGRGEESYIAGLRDKLKGITFEFLGVIKPADFYSQVDVCIVPSLWDEPFGRIVIESLSSSVPVCIAASGGLKELHYPACTWLFNPVGNELRQLAERILENKQEIEQKRRNCLRHAALFSESNIVKNYLDVYTQLVDE